MRRGTSNILAILLQRVYWYQQRRLLLSQDELREEISRWLLVVGY